MKFLHSMIRVRNLEKSLEFYCDFLGLKEVRRKEVPSARFTLIFLAANPGEAEIELTYNWDAPDSYGNARNFGHLAFQVDDIYEKCEFLSSKGIDILRPPRDGHMAFIKSPDDISIELLQSGNPLEPKEPWLSMQNKGSW